MTEKDEKQQQPTVAAGQTVGVPKDGPDELTKNDLDEVVGGSFHYYLTVRGTKQNP